MYLFTKVSSHGNTDCPPKVCSSPAFSEQWLSLRGTSWDSPLQCAEAGIFSNVTAASCLWEIYSGNKIVLDCCSNKVRVLRARTVAVSTSSVIHLSYYNIAFPPSLWCLLLSEARFLSHQRVEGLVGANPQCYTTHLVEFFCDWQLMWTFLLRLYKINLGGFSHLSRLSISITACRRNYLVWCLSSVLSTLFLSLLSGIA